MLNKTVKKILFSAISSLLGIGLFILVFKKIGPREIVGVLSEFSLWKGIIVFLIFLLEMIILTWRWGLILKSQGHCIPFKKLFIAKLVGFSVNYITPILYTGGEPMRAYVLKKETGISFLNGLTSIFIDEIMDIISGSLFFMLGIIFLLANFNIPDYVLSPSLLIIFAALVFWIYFYTKLKSDKGFFTSIINFFRLNKLNLIRNNKEKIIKLENEIMHFFKYKEKTFFISFFLTAIAIILSLIQFKLILYFLNYNISIKEIIFIRTLLVAAYIIPIPASLGSLEGIGAITFVILGLQAELGITFTLIIRAISFIIAGAGLFFLSHFGVKLTKIFLNKNLNNNDHKKI